MKRKQAGQAGGRQPKKQRRNEDQENNYDEDANLATGPELGRPRVFQGKKKQQEMSKKNPTFWSTRLRFSKAVTQDPATFTQEVCDHLKTADDPFWVGLIPVMMESWFTWSNFWIQFVEDGLLARKYTMMPFLMSFVETAITQCITHKIKLPYIFSTNFTDRWITALTQGITKEKANPSKKENSKKASKNKDNDDTDVITPDVYNKARELYQRLQLLKDVNPSFFTSVAIAACMHPSAEKIFVQSKSKKDNKKEESTNKDANKAERTFSQKFLSPILRKSLNDENDVGAQFLPYYISHLERLFITGDATFVLPATEKEKRRKEVERRNFVLKSLTQIIEHVTFKKSALVNSANHNASFILSILRFLTFFAFHELADETNDTTNTSKKKSKKPKKSDASAFTSFVTDMSEIGKESKYMSGVNLFTCLSHLLPFSYRAVNNNNIILVNNANQTETLSFNSYVLKTIQEMISSNLTTISASTTNHISETISLQDVLRSKQQEIPDAGKLELFLSSVMLAQLDPAAQSDDEESEDDVITDAIQYVRNVITPAPGKAGKKQLIQSESKQVWADVVCAVMSTDSNFAQHSMKNVFKNSLNELDLNTLSIFVEAADTNPEGEEGEDEELLKEDEENPSDDDEIDPEDLNDVFNFLSGQAAEDDDNDDGQEEGEAEAGDGDVAQVNDDNDLVDENEVELNDDDMEALDFEVAQSLRRANRDDKASASAFLANIIEILGFYVEKNPDKAESRQIILRLSNIVINNEKHSLLAELLIPHFKESFHKMGKVPEDEVSEMNGLLEAAFAKLLERRKLEIPQETEQNTEKNKNSDEDGVDDMEGDDDEEDEDAEKKKAAARRRAKREFTEGTEMIELFLENLILLLFRISPDTSQFRSFDWPALLTKYSGKSKAKERASVTRFKTQITSFLSRILSLAPDLGLTIARGAVAKLNDDRKKAQHNNLILTSLIPILEQASLTKSKSSEQISSDLALLVGDLASKLREYIEQEASNSTEAAKSSKKATNENLMMKSFIKIFSSIFSMMNSLNNLPNLHAAVEKSGVKEVMKEGVSKTSNLSKQMKSHLGNLSSLLFGKHTTAETPAPTEGLTAVEKIKQRILAEQKKKVAEIKKKGLPANVSHKLAHSKKILPKQASKKPTTEPATVPKPKLTGNPGNASHKKARAQRNQEKEKARASTAPHLQSNNINSSTKNNNNKSNNNTKKNNNNSNNNQNKRSEGANKKTEKPRNNRPTPKKQA